MAGTTQEWLSVPGMEVPSSGNWNPGDYSFLVKDRKMVANFIEGDVFGFYGNDTWTVIFTNRLNPIHYLLNISVEQFKKELA